MKLMHPVTDNRLLILMTPSVHVSIRLYLMPDKVLYIKGIFFLSLTPSLYVARMSQSSCSQQFARILLSRFEYSVAFSVCLNRVQDS